MKVFLLIPLRYQQKRLALPIFAFYLFSVWNQKHIKKTLNYSMIFNIHQWWVFSSFNWSYLRINRYLSNPEFTMYIHNIDIFNILQWNIILVNCTGNIETSQENGRWSLTTGIISRFRAEKFVVFLSKLD